MWGETVSEAGVGGRRGWGGGGGEGVQEWRVRGVGGRGDGHEGGAGLPSTTNRSLSYHNRDL